jgi:hypothetical protein
MLCLFLKLNNIREFLGQFSNCHLFKEEPLMLEVYLSNMQKLSMCISENTVSLVQMSSTSS